jgi:hypothetical protein
MEHWTAMLFNVIFLEEQYAIYIKDKDIKSHSTIKIRNLCLIMSLGITKRQALAKAIR